MPTIYSTFVYTFYLISSLNPIISADDISTATVVIDSQNLQETSFLAPLNQTNTTETMNMVNIGDALKICTTTNSQTGITAFGGPLNDTYWLHCVYIKYNNSKSGTSGILYEGKGTPVTAVSYWIKKDFSNIEDATANAYGVFVLKKPVQIVRGFNDSFDAGVESIVNQTGSSNSISSDDVFQFYGIDHQLSYYYVCTTLSEFIVTGSDNQNTTSVWYEITVVTPSWYRANISENTYYDLVTSQFANGQSTNDSTVYYYTLPDTEDVFYALNQPYMNLMSSS